MSSALSTAQKYALFQILEVPWNNAGTGSTYGYNTLDGMGSLSSQTNISNATQGVAQTQILQYLDDLHTNNVELETELASQLTTWISYGPSSLKMDHGGVDDISGLSFDFETEKKIVADYVKWAVPFFKWNEVLAKKSGAAGGGGIAVAGIR